MPQPSRAVLAAAVCLVASAPGCRPPAEEGPTMEEIAESFVKLALAVGEHDPDYVDAYLGPEEWREEVAAEQAALPTLRERAAAALDALGALPPAGDRLAEMRRRNLDKTLRSLIARVDLLAGTEMSFDEESAALYDAVAPTHPAEHFQEILDRLGETLPGEGPLVARWDAFRADFVIPAERLDAVFQAAIEACRERTAPHLELPAEESFTVEYVTDKSWSGYNWYKGGYHSLIQVNTDLPIHIDRAVDLACHEGYPGHHVYNLLVERDLVAGRGWTEFTVYPLFSPRSLIAEGTANFGIDVAFPGDERVVFEREVLYPLAGLDPGRAGDYQKVLAMVRELSYAGNEAARRYLDGELDAAGAAAWLETYALMPPERASQRVRFMEQYRSYVINYNLGEDLVRGWVAAQGGIAADPEARWAAFERLLSEPWLPSDLE